MAIPLGQSAINLNAGATLLMLYGDEPRWFGTLQSAIQRVMALPERDRWRAAVLVGREAGATKMLLRLTDLRVLAERLALPGNTQ
jgi:hypothetical protein